MPARAKPPLILLSSQFYNLKLHTSLGPHYPSSPTTHRNATTVLFLTQQSLVVSLMGCPPLQLNVLVMSCPRPDTFSKPLSVKAPPTGHTLSPPPFLAQDRALPSLLVYVVLPIQICSTHLIPSFQEHNTRIWLTVEFSILPTPVLLITPLPRSMICYCLILFRYQS